MANRCSLLTHIIRQHKWKLTITYCLFSVEMLGLIIRPFLLGNAVNQLLEKKYTGLLILGIVHIGYIIVGTVRHMYDTRTYATIYSELVTSFLIKNRQFLSTSKLSAHSTLSREFVDFLEHDLIFVVEALYNVVGAFIFLLLYKSTLAYVCLAFLFPISIISYYYGKSMQLLNLHKNDELEKEVDCIESGNVKDIQNHYNKLKKWQIRISDKEAYNFGIMELFVLAIICISLLITTSNNTIILAGDIIGIYFYLLKFTAGLDTVPYIFQRLSSLKDIANRIGKVSGNV
jgi:ABC-type multidrug transport system fused ATPase/permease subunit